MATELWARDIGVDLQGRVLLDSADLRIRAGEMVVITGPSGSGKTTFLLVMAGLHVPDRGQVLLDGQALRDDDQFRRRFGVVLQNHGLVSVLTATENVAVVLQARRVARTEVTRRTAAALAGLGLQDSADRLVRDLSGGQRQRVGLARALVGEPEVLVADEPSSELDAEQRALVLGQLQAHARKGNIVIVASHDPKVAEAGDRAVPLVDGRPAA